MKYNKYIKNNNIIHDVEIYGLKDLIYFIPNCDIILRGMFQNNENKIFKDLLNILIENNDNISIRYQKQYKQYGKQIINSRVLSQNINCYKNETKDKEITIYYDVINKFNEKKDFIINRFLITYYIIKKLDKINYKVNFIPVLFLKAFEGNEKNEYVYIKLKEFNLEDIKNSNFIIDKNVSRIILPEIIKRLDITNKKELDYNGFLLERQEKENIINLKGNDILIDMFDSLNLFNGDIIHDSKFLTKKLNL